MVGSFGLWSLPVSLPLSLRHFVGRGHDVLDVLEDGVRGGGVGVRLVLLFRRGWGFCGGWRGHAVDDVPDVLDLSLGGGGVEV